MLLITNPSILWSGLLQSDNDVAEKKNSNGGLVSLLIQKNQLDGPILEIAYTARTIPQSSALAESPPHTPINSVPNWHSGNQNGS
ncbi:uncharacterized protein PADG_12195 [Paracoccidioides brasiliensis Pb18]|uniref:Uncharacterized protein n=1 Tax=Paracoccidioides brasiliensis (strain Pb18) TaxID=502780 RepID=A0A0A0HSY8_PARBD|nr:uncharacterized protein PADG_12195 [Paracoccidioides brasiliensis Pb18]KGM91737.1 hypothetical protein PADG_12195 [Paracoccidioides brasiliensis Pb18]